MTTINECHAQAIGEPGQPTGPTLYRAKRCSHANQKNMGSRCRPFAKTALCIALSGGLIALAPAARADAISDLKAQIDAMQKQSREQIEALQKKFDELAAAQAQAVTQAAAAKAPPAADKAGIVKLLDKDGWTATMSGLIDVRTGPENFGAASGRSKENTTRVISGFNPSKLEFSVNAPEYNGFNVSGYFQIATSINGSKTQRTGEQIEVRGADISIASRYGTVSAGRNFNIYASLPTVNDTGSMKGVGYICTGPDGNGPNCGHIGTGYSWPDWTAGIRYASPRISGFQFRAGAYDPVETAFGVPGGGAPFVAVADLQGRFNGTFTNFTSIGQSVQTRTPMFQGDVTWASGPISLGGHSSGSALVWVGGLNQRLKDGPSGTTANIDGYNLGSRLTMTAPLGVFGLTSNYEKTHGIAEGFIGMGARCNASGCDTTRGQQWYLNADYTYAGKTTFGVSHGRGWENANAIVGNSDVKRQLQMIYVQHQLTPYLNVSAEFSHFKRTTDSGGPGAAAGIFAAQERINAFLVGLQLGF